MLEAGRWVQLDGRSRLVDRYPWLWRYVVVNQGCVDRVADSYGGSYVSQVFAVVGQSVTASRYVDCVIPCKSVEVEKRLGPCWAPWPCGRIGRERRLCRVQSRADERTRAKALSGQSRADERTRAKALSGQSCAVERTRAKALSGPKPCGRADKS